jgi:hypothetical protein
MSETERVREGRKGTTPTRWTDSEARKAMNALKEALESAGITLPSMGIDEGSVLLGSPLVELGRARPDVIEELTELVLRGMARE